jgi:hypothetical protein
VSGALQRHQQLNILKDLERRRGPNNLLISSYLGRKHLSTVTKFIAVLALAAPLVCMAQASAATYKLQIEGGTGILKIYLDNGTAHRVSQNRDTAIYEMEMNGGECMANLRLQFSNNASPLHVQYDVCSEKGFGLTMRTIRF